VALAVLGGAILTPVVLTPAQAAFVQKFVNVTVTTLASLGAVVVGNPAGGSQGPGTVNATGPFYQNGTQYAASHLSNGTTGSGPVVLATSPTLTTPVLGTATATGITSGFFRATASAISAFASHLSMDQATSSISRILAWGPNASTNGILSLETARSDGTGAVIPLKLQAGGQMGSVQGGDKGLGALNLLSLWFNGVQFSAGGTRGYAAYFSSALGLAGSPSVQYVEAQANWNGTPTQNRAAIQAAHDACPLAGCIIQLPAGVFATDGATITFLKPVTIQGAGPSYSLNTTILTNSATIDVFTVNLSDPVAFRNFKINSSAARTGGAYIHFATTTNVFSIIDHMVFIGHQRALDMEFAELWAVTNSYFSGQAISSNIDIYIHSTNADNGGHLIQGNVFDNGGTTGTCVQLNSGGGTRIIGNQMLGHGVKLNIDWTATGNSSELAIIGNTFDAQGPSGQNFGVIINGNTGAGTLSTITIVGNTFAGHAVNELVFGGSAPEKINNVVVTGNVFQVNSGSVGISTAGAGVHISGNHFTSNGATPRGVDIQGAATANAVWGNSFRGTWSSKVANFSGSSLMGVTDANYENGIRVN